MINEGKYCVDVLNQVKAAKLALVTVESKILKRHIESCIKLSLKNKNTVDAKVEELLKLINKWCDYRCINVLIPKANTKTATTYWDTAAAISEKKIRIEPLVLLFILEWSCPHIGYPDCLVWVKIYTGG